MGMHGWGWGYFPCVWNESFCFEILWILWIVGPFVDCCVLRTVSGDGLWIVVCLLCVCCVCVDVCILRSCTALWIGEIKKSRLAQLVERETVNLEASGSIPLARAIPFLIRPLCYGLVFTHLSNFCLACQWFHYFINTSYFRTLHNQPLKTSTAQPPTHSLLTMYSLCNPIMYKTTIWSTSSSNYRYDLIVAILSTN